MIPSPTAKLIAAAVAGILPANADFRLLEEPIGIGDLLKAAY